VSGVTAGIIPAPNPPLPGCAEAIDAAGIVISIAPDGWHVSDVDGAQSIIDAFTPDAHVKAQALATIAAECAAVIASGHTTAAGIPMATDEQSLIRLVLTAAAATANKSARYKFKDRAGRWHTLTSPQVIAIQADVGAFAQRCVDYESALAAKIDAAADWHAVLELDLLHGWPANT
jgi:hypothetical protein